MKNPFKSICTKWRNQKQNHEQLMLERQYNVTIKGGSLYIVNGDFPVAIVDEATTIYYLLEQVNQMKESYKRYNQC